MATIYSSENLHKHGVSPEEVDEVLPVMRKRSEALQRRIEADARKRVIKRGIMHFRCDEEMMEQLLQVADYKKLPTGSMVRSWVAEKLREELKLHF